MGAGKAWSCWALAWLLAWMPAQAREPAVPGLGPEWRRVEPAALEAQRGGFVMPSGLQASFGFERTVHVNGALVSSLRVRVADVGRITAEEAAQLAALGRTQLIQIGAGNAAPADVAGLVIQNSLDGQRIQVRSTLDASSNALGLLQALNAAQALQATTATSVGGL
ncbi:hypothetical protein [Luteimonas kalidii]|uniref:Uncharacterized protein n=1 Tax=Luteimonas kalidii TaxID=3042025 RepID=A0ABT6JP30_9GAMM|nr:hypothetical protein [Luteimonas kalidii]MDH5832448.1 hypothetical protein [Luteimonas kalidii]